LILGFLGAWGLIMILSISTMVAAWFLVTWWLFDSWLSGGWLILGNLFSWWLLDFLMILGCVVASCFWVHSWSHVGCFLRTSHKNYLRHVCNTTDRTQTTLTSFYPKH
jgi:uncharacterized membrane protein